MIFPSGWPASDIALGANLVMNPKVRPQVATSIYPLRPPGSEVILKYDANDLTTYDRAIVYLSSLFFVGSAFWVPALYIWAWKKFQSIPKSQRKRRALYVGFIVAASAFFAIGPHRNRRVGEWVNAPRWSLWNSWFRFFAFEVVADQGLASVKPFIDKQAIVAVSPHGIFPFGLAFAALSDASAKAFGRFRAVVASATQMIPWVRDVLRWVDAVDASRSAVDQALSEGSRIGLAPGGIAEMFEGYPKSGTHPDEEYAIVRKGMFRLAVKHNVPVVPIYCFGSTNLLRRLQLPSLVEKLSLVLRVSLVLFYGQCFLPIPFRQKLLYVMGNPIHPTHHTSQAFSVSESLLDQRVDDMFARYCDEMIRLFDRQKESYGWPHKTLKLVTR